ANALFMYTNFLGKTYYGLTAFLLSSANIIMPLMAFGVHNTMVKFYSGYKTENEKSQFLTFMVLLPVLMVIPVSVTGIFFYDQIATALSRENPIIHNYVWLIPLISLCMGYFEIFYAWVKVHLKSVYGSFIREIMLRVLISVFLYAVHWNWITPIQFVYITVGIYFTITMLMVFSAFKVRRPTFQLKLPHDRRHVFIYSMFIILSGSVATLLLDIDKFMLSQYINIDNVAYYSVAIFITTVIAVPSRAMHQIAYPITAKLMTENKYGELNDFYKKTSISLQVVGGYVLLGILINIKQVYLLLPPEYSGGVFVVFTIGLSKYFDLILGNNNAIIFNSIYYRMVLFLGLLLAFFAITLNMLLIPSFGINGAAMATLVAITLYSLSKLLFVVLRMKLFPFTKKTLVSLAISLVTFMVFYYWEFPFRPLPNILLKSALMSIVYGLVNYQLKISEDINLVVTGLIQRFKK
ncbi:MAG: lipopolysaccharide biosynthesis protein, partial [Flavobacterium sp.]